jgi:hypothetical protein
MWKYPPMPVPTECGMPLLKKLIVLRTTSVQFFGMEKWMIKQLRIHFSYTISFVVKSLSLIKQSASPGKEYFLNCISSSSPTLR